MILKLIRKFGKEEEPKRPYTGATIKTVHIHHFLDSKHNYGTIEFENGGKEEFKTRTPEALIKKMNSFMAIL